MVDSPVGTLVEHVELTPVTKAVLHVPVTSPFSHPVLVVPPELSVANVASQALLTAVQPLVVPEAPAAVQTVAVPDALTAVQPLALEVPETALTTAVTLPLVSTPLYVKAVPVRSTGAAALQPPLQWLAPVGKTMTSLPPE